MHKVRELRHDRIKAVSQHECSLFLSLCLSRTTGTRLASTAKDRARTSPSRANVYGREHASFSLQFLTRLALPADDDGSGLQELRSLRHGEWQAEQAGVLVYAGASRLRGWFGAWGEWFHDALRHWTCTRRALCRNGGGSARTTRGR